MYKYIKRVLDIIFSLILLLVLFLPMILIIILIVLIDREKPFFTKIRTGKNGKKKRVRVPKLLTYKEALKNTTIFTSTVMFNMNYLSKDDIYMPNIRRGQDTATWWNILKKEITAYAMNEVLSVYRIDNKTSLSSNKFTALKRTWKIYKMQDTNFFKRLYYFNCYIFNAIKRRI